MRHPITLSEVFGQKVDLSPAVTAEAAEPTYAVPVQDLMTHVQPFVQPARGLGHAWRELYHAYQGASANPDLLRAVHDIMEAVEDTPRGAEFVSVPVQAAGALQSMADERNLIADYYRRSGDHEISGALFMINHGLNLYNWGSVQPAANAAPDLRGDFANTAGGNVIAFPAQHYMLERHIA